MLEWSLLKYKFTLGLSCLGMAGAMSELWKPQLAVWAVLAICLIPLTLFVFFDPADLPARWVRFAHLFGSLWFVLLAIILTVALCVDSNFQRGWLLFPLTFLPGLIPCVIVLQRAVRGQYTLLGEEDPNEQRFS
jgi:hypothetical protein